jgi:hypothetical protein
MVVFAGVSWFGLREDRRNSGMGMPSMKFIGWYWSEPHLVFNRGVVLRYRFFLEQENLKPSTINVRLAALRRLVHEAGLLNPELAEGIGRVKGAKRLGTRIGNWLTIEQPKNHARGTGTR